MPVEIVPATGTRPRILDVYGILSVPIEDFPLLAREYAADHSIPELFPEEEVAESQRLIKALFGTNTTLKKIPREYVSWIRKKQQLEQELGLRATVRYDN